MSGNVINQQRYTVTWVRWVNEHQYDQSVTNFHWNKQQCDCGVNVYRVLLYVCVCVSWFTRHEVFCNLVLVWCGDQSRFVLYYNYTLMRYSVHP
jgi:hypothetical protein